MSIPTFNHEVVRKRHYIFCFQVLQSGVAVDITGSTLTFTAKWDLNNADAAAVIKKDNVLLGGIVITNAANGQATLTVDPADTSALPLHRVDLYYDIKYTDATPKSYPLFIGTYSVFPNVTDG